MLTLLFRTGFVQRWLVYFGLVMGLCLAMGVRADWEWSPTVKNLSASGQDARIPHVAANNNGTAMAVWPRFNGANWIIQAAQYRNNLWGNPVVISDRFGDGALPRVAVNGSGNARAIWIRSNGSNDVVETAGYHISDNQWSSATRLSDLGQNATTPQIAMNEAGTTAMVWTRFNGTNWIVQANLYINGAFYPTAAVSSLLRDAYTPEAVVDASGVITVVWTQLNNQTNTRVIRGSSYRNGSWGPITDISSPNLDARSPQLSVDANGNVMVVWMQANGQLSSIEGRRWVNGVGWGNILNLSAVTQNADTPQVAADSPGTAIAVWTQQQNDGLWSVRTRRFSNGDWGALSVFASGGQNAYFPKIAADNSGGATAVWMRSNGANSLIRASHYRSGAWTPTATLSTVGQNADLPQVAMLGNDRATLVWLRNNGNNWIVQAREGTYIVNRYNLTLNKAGSGTGTVVSTPTGIDCGKTCSAKYDQDTQVTLTATPAEGSNFIGWSGACSGTGNCVLKMTGNQTVSAKFAAAAAYALKITKAATGTVTSVPEGIHCGEKNSACKFAFGQDAVVTLTASPKAGYYFKRWDGCASLDELNCRVTVARPTTTVTPRFVALPKYVLQISKTKFGSISSEPAGLKCGDNAKSCSAKFVTGTTVVLTAIPAPDRSFVGWGDGACSGSAPTCIVTMDAKKKVSAAFQ